MTTTYEPNVVLSQVDYDVVGTRPIRPDGVDKVTGRAKYGADFQIAGALYGKLVRSPHAHAKIISIDTSKAEAHPAVKAVVTGADFPETVIGPDGERLSTTIEGVRGGAIAVGRRGRSSGEAPMDSHARWQTAFGLGLFAAWQRALACRVRTALRQFERQVYATERGTVGRRRIRGCVGEFPRYATE